MSQNPNMLRTMIGIGLTLIFVLGYAVYSNTIESEYYGYETTNISETLEPDQDDCLLYTSPSPRDRTRSRMPSSA